MKNKNIFLMLAASVALIMSSCSIEKRQYTNGYHIEWNSALKSTKKPIKSTKNVVEQASQTTVESMLSLEASTHIALPEQNVAEASIEPMITIVAKNQSIVSKYFTSKAEERLSSVSSSQVANNKVIVKAKSKEKSGDDVPIGLLYILCILIPFVAVGIVTDWDVKTVVINLLWSLLCFIPGIIHAFIVVSREY
jgi:uncharacterized membrane protein YqaE (UPF0057 family)